jgi:hypothetical protein
MSALFDTMLQKAAITLGLSVGGWMLSYPFRAVFNSAKEEWHEKTQLLSEVHQELKQQRTNCLTTLQSQGDQQIKLLEKTVDTLEQIHLGQTEMAGFIKASSSRR